MRITAAVTEARGAPFELAQLGPGELRAGEVLVEVAAAGICHTDGTSALVRSGAPVRSHGFGQSSFATHSLRGRFAAGRLTTFYDFDRIEQAEHDAETGVAIEAVLRMT